MNTIIEKTRDLYINSDLTLKEISKEVGKSLSTVKVYIKDLSGTRKLKKQRTDEKRKSDNVRYVSNRRRRIKEMAIEYKGGKCVKCGYNTCNGALEFHHLNPDEKDFNIGQKGYSRSWEKTKEELDKCILVCSNCHKEIHNCN